MKFILDIDSREAIEILNSLEQADAIKEKKMGNRDINIYQELIEERAFNDSPEIIPNAGGDHAAIVMSKLFEKTNQTANMIVGSFEGTVSDQSNYLKELNKCIKRNVQFKIIFLDDPNKSSKALKILDYYKKTESKNITFAKATDAVRKRFTKRDNEIHLSVFDDNKYRIEKDTKKFMAWVCFNDKVGSGQFLEIFNKAFEESTLLS